MSEASNQMQDYIDRLKSHDWYYAYADDGRVFRQGKAAEDTLVKLRKELDPDNSIWNEHAPEGYKIISEEVRAEKTAGQKARTPKEGKVKKSFTAKAGKSKKPLPSAPKMSARRKPAGKSPKR